MLFVATPVHVKGSQGSHMSGARISRGFCAGQVGTRRHRSSSITAGSGPALVSFPMGRNGQIPSCLSNGDPIQTTPIAACAACVAW